MKTVLKSLVIGLTVFVLSFAPPLASMAQAGSIHYEGISSVNSDTQSKGLMLNFSFGGPKDYKPESSLQDIYKASLTKNQWVGLGAATLGVIVLILINDDDDEDDECINPQQGGSPGFAPVYLSQTRVCPPDDI